jgi:type VI secretion system ImpM family protein
VSGVTASVHCFGKLPIAGDFIRYRLDAEEPRGFAGWVEKGQALVEAVTRSGGAKSAPAAAPRRYRFCLDQGSGRRLVAGILHESHDRGQLRRFPFCLFAAVEASAFRARPALLPYLLSEGWSSCEEKLAALGGVSRVEELTRGLDGFAPAIPEPSKAAAADLDAALGRERAGALWGRVLPGRPPDGRLHLFDILVRALQPFQKTRPEEAPVALKLPVGGTRQEVALQAAFWVELLCGFLSGSRQAPNLFLAAPAAAEPAKALHVFFQRPDEKSFASLMTQKYESEYVDDLTAAPPPPRGAAVLGERQRRMLLADDASLMDLARFRWL